jgi:hypothetical protein
MDILKADTFTIRTGEQLTLSNSRFPYPPGRRYDVIIPAGVQMKSVNTTGYIPGEGGSSFYTDVFTFLQPGTYELHVVKYKYGTGREDIEFARDVTVRVCTAT